MKEVIPIRWPNGRLHQRLCNSIRTHKQMIKQGRVLAIDPASGKSSNPGYAFWIAGELQEFGDIDVDSKLSIQSRLAQICDCVSKEFPDIDVLVIEQIRGQRVHPTLFWSIGAVVSHVRPPILLETPLWTWKALAKATPQYKKSDDLDAVMIGGCVMYLAGIEERFL